MTEREQLSDKTEEEVYDKTEEEVYNLTQEIEYDQQNDQLNLVNLYLDVNPRTQTS